MFKLFKSKTKKKESLENKVIKLTEKYKHYLNSYCFDGNDIIIYQGFSIRNNELVLEYIDTNTPEGCVTFMPWWILEIKYEHEFIKKHRIRFIKLRDQMQKLSLSVVKVKENEKQKLEFAIEQLKETGSLNFKGEFTSKKLNQKIKELEQKLSQL